MHMSRRFGVGVGPKMTEFDEEMHDLAERARLFPDDGPARCEVEPDEELLSDGSPRCRAPVWPDVVALRQS